MDPETRPRRGFRLTLDPTTELTLNQDGTVRELTKAEAESLEALVGLRNQADYDRTASVRHQLEQRARALKAANKRRETAMSGLTAVVRSAAELGIPETQLAELAGVDRMTVRRMLGKR
jgi:hypothetical protein